MIYGAKTINMKETMAIKMVLYLAVCNTESSALSGCPAPRFWPTKVAAALLIPQAGNRKNMITRIAIWYPALASLWPVCTTRLASTIQLPLPIKNCNVPGQAMFINDLIISKSGVSAFNVNLTIRLPLNKWYNW